MATSTERLTRENEELQQVVQELEEQNRRLETKILEIFTLYNVSKALSLSYQLEELLAVAVKMINSSLEVHEFGLYVADSVDRTDEDADEDADEDEDEDEDDKPLLLQMRIYEGEFASEQPVDLEAEGDHLIGAVFRSGQITQLFDASETNYENRCWLPKGKGSILAVPVTLGEGGDAVGVLVARSATAGGFSPEDERMFRSIAGHLAVAIENASIFQRTQELSFVDPLTRVYNRRYFEERLTREISRAERYHRPFQILLIDVDNFKSINDRLGHQYGDFVLSKIAQILREELRASDVVARYGGDEFIVLLPESEGLASDRVMFKLRRALRSYPWKEFDAYEMRLGLTVGVAAYPEEGLTPKELVAFADKELYKFKDRAKQRDAAAR